MNALLLERSSGNLGPAEFARIQTTWLLRSFSAAPRLRFDGGERAAGSSNTSTAGNSEDVDDAPRASLWAHQAGVSALALERFDGRM
jgi:DNA excision repair protein ERCC-8